MLIKNDERIGLVEGIGTDGEGIVKEEGLTVFLPFAFLGEKVRYKILKVKKNIAYGKVLEVITPAEKRVRPKCPIFFKCGGCHYQHLSYDAQLTIKKDTIKNCLHKIGGLQINSIKVEKSLKTWGYRNKLQIPVTEVKGKTIIGFYAESTHRAVETDDCPISDWAKDVISIFKDYVEKFNIKGYNEENHTGDLRHIVVRGIDGKFIITAVCLKDNLKGLDYLEQKLLVKFPKHSLFINVNDKETNVIFGDKFHLKYGKERYQADMLNVKYEFGVMSFMQINTEVAERIYKKVVDLATLDEDTIVIDAYSGAGLMTAMLAKKAKKAYGIEIIKEAVECADSLKSINALTDKMENICGKCEEVLPPLISKLKKSGEKISLVLDPPRKGCDVKVINAILECEIDKIIYVSCNPSTLARDLGLLTGALKVEDGKIIKVGNFDAKTDVNLNYNVTFIQGYDMFPHTKHVETLVCLARKAN